MKMMLHSLLHRKMFVVIAIVISLFHACAQNGSSETVQLRSITADNGIANATRENAISVEVSDTIIPKQAERIFSKEELLGKLDPATHPDFTKILSAHTSKPNIYLRIEAYNAFKKMATAAQNDGIKIFIISATRNFDYQKGIWEKKWQRERYAGWNDLDKVKDIMKYSAMPGASRHHWGTDVDFNSVELAYFSGGEGKKLYEWLVKNAGAFGFIQTYTSKKDGRTGYDEEKWHWSYLPLASQMLEQYNQKISYDDFNGFHGAESAKSARVIEDFVNGIQGN